MSESTASISNISTGSAMLANQQESSAQTSAAAVSRVLAAAMNQSSAFASAATATLPGASAMSESSRMIAGLSLAIVEAANMRESSSQTSAGIAQAMSTAVMQTLTAMTTRITNLPAQRLLSIFLADGLAHLGQIDRLNSDGSTTTVPLSIYSDS